jgi:hypothetical protein
MSHGIHLFVVFDLIWPERDGLGQWIGPCPISENRPENTNRWTGDTDYEARATARCAKTAILNDYPKPQMMKRGLFAAPFRETRISRML